MLYGCGESRSYAVLVVIYYFVEISTFRPKAMTIWYVPPPSTRNSGARQLAGARQLLDRLPQNSALASLL